MQVNADRYVEQTVLVEVPSKRGVVDDPAEVRPRVYNVVMEPIKTATAAANSVASDGKPYTYWLINGGRRVGATDRVAAAAAAVTSTERLSAPWSAERPEQEEDGDGDHFYAIATDSDDPGADVDLRLMRLPVFSFSASGAPSNRPSWPYYTVTLLSLYVTLLVANHCSHYTDALSLRRQQIL